MTYPNDYSFHRQAKIAIYPALCCINPLTRSLRKTIGHLGLGSSNTFWTSSGLAHFAQSQLEAEGFHVNTEDFRKFAPAVRASKALLAHEATTGGDLCQTYANVEHGVLEIQNEGQRLKYIKLFCKLFPNAKIAIIQNDKKEAQRFCDDLSAELGETVSLFVGNAEVGSNDARVGVISINQLKNFRIEPIHIMIISDVTKVLYLDAIEWLYKPNQRQPRVFGILLANDHLTADEDILMQALCGPILYSTGYRHESFTVMTCDAPAGPHTAGMDYLQRKQARIVHNRRRNALIALIARACYRKDMACLHDRGLFASENDSDILRRISRPMVSVLVETVEHARALHRLLPSWPIYSTASLADTTDADAAGFHSPCRIETIQHAAKHKMPVNVLIRCDHAATSNTVYGLPKYDPMQWHPLFVIELNDSYDKKTRRVLQQRLAAYQRSGGIVPVHLCRSPVHFPAAITKAADGNGDDAKLSLAVENAGSEDPPNGTDSRAGAPKPECAANDNQVGTFSSQKATEASCTNSMPASLADQGMNSHQAQVMFGKYNEDSPVTGHPDSRTLWDKKPKEAMNPDNA